MSWSTASKAAGGVLALLVAVAAVVFGTAAVRSPDAAAAVVATRGSSLVVQFAGLPEWVPRGSGPVAAVVNVTNVGLAPATNVQVYVSGQGTIVPGACAPGTFGSVCSIPVVEPGATVAFAIEFTPPAAFGYGSVAAYVVGKDDQSSPDVQGYVRAVVESTDGTVQVPYLAFTSWPAVGRTGEALGYDGVLVNLGDQPLPASQVWVQARTFLEVQAVAAISTSAGGCSYVDDSSLGQWGCPIPALQPGQRVAIRFDVRTASPAEFRAHYRLALSIPDARPWWDTARGAKVKHEVETLFNSSRYADVAISVASPGTAKVGATTVQRVTVANAGPDDARGLEVNGSLRGPGRFVGLTNGACVGGARRATCVLGRLAPKASRTLDLSVESMAIGTVETSYSVTGASFDPNVDDNVTGIAVTAQPTPPPPFRPVLAKAKAIALRQALAKGIAATVTCPVACTVRQELWLPRKQALRLGLRLPKRGDLLLGTRTVSRKGPGKATTVAKVKPALARALAAKGRTITVRQVVVASAGTAKQSFSRNLVLKAVKPKAKR